MHKKVLGVGLVALIAGASLLFFGTEEAQVQSVVYRTVSAEPMTPNSYSAQLRLIARVDNQGFTPLHSLVHGRIETVGVKSSQVVKAGKALVCVSRKQAKLDYQHKLHDCDLAKEKFSAAKKEVKRLDALVKHSKEMLANAANSYQRAENMYAKEHLSQQELEQAHSQWLKTQSEHESLLNQAEKSHSAVNQQSLAVKKCKAMLSKLEKTLHDQCVYAPDDGQIVDVLVAKGAVVSSGTPLVHFVPDKERQLRAMLLSRQLEAVSSGVKQAQFLKQGVGELSFEGVIDTHHGSGFEAIFMSKNKLPHGQAYDVLLELKPVKHALLLSPQMLYQQRYIFSLKAVPGTKLHELVKVPVNCIGYRWTEEEERLNLCVPQQRKLPGPVLDTHIEGALSGMRVSVLGDDE